MATGYKIDFTDQNPFRSFDLREYTTNGPVNPQNGTLDPKATSAATTLLLHGRGMPNYGERLQENMLHLLEHFSGSIEPVYPVGGQMWNDTSQSPSQLRVYDPSRYEIVVDPDNPSSAAWIAILPPSAEEETELLARYASGARVRITNESSGEQFEHTVATGAAVRGGGQVAFQLTPGPTSIYTVGGWFVGGWEFIMQSNAPLREDLDAGTHNITNLAAPTANDHATNRLYVDTAISNAIAGTDSLGELNDVTITAPANNHILVYDPTLNGGSGGWKNSTGSTVFLRTTGGLMSGTLDMGNNFVINVLSPTAGHHAANRDYVDAEIAAATGGFVSDLDGLSDVTITAPGNGDILSYDNGTSQWVERTQADFITSNNLVTTAGATMTGPIYLHAITPTLLNEAASMGYVLNEISSAISASGDGVVDTALWEPVSKTLTLTRTNGLPDIDVALTGAGGSSFDIIHNIADPNAVGTPLPSDPVALAWETLFYNHVGYPTVPVEDVIAQLNDKIGRLGSPKWQFIFTANGNSVLNLDEPSVAGQMNPAWPAGSGGGEQYAVGTHRLQIYVNGIKQIASEAGYREVVTATPAGFGLWHGTSTGLSIGTTYTFNVSVNGQAAVTVSILGDDAQRVGNLMDAINAQADANYFQSGSPNSQWAFGCRLFDGNLFFVSGLTGTGSSIDLTDGSTNPLFASMVGDVSGTGSFTIDLPLSNGETNYFPPQDRGYKEIGRFGAESLRVEFVTNPPSGSTVEVILEPDIFIEYV